MAKTNRYQALISKIFLERYKPKSTAFEFAREDLETAAQELGIKLPKKPWRRNLLGSVSHDTA
jgi:K+-sensing histidine kinase KdpD